MRSRAVLQASASHLDLSRAPYALYGVHYIDLVSLAPFLGYQRAAVVTQTLTWVVRPMVCTVFTILT